MPYTVALFAAALVNPSPGQVLNIGLGAGAFDRLFDKAFPRARLLSVEVDPMILELAQAYTGFRKGTRGDVVIADGRRYLHQSRTTWDWIVLDAYVKRSQVPLHLTTLEFYRLVRAHLSPGGVFVANVMSGTALFQSHVQTLAEAFPQVAFFPVPRRSNVIAMGVTFTDPDIYTLLREVDLGRLPDLKAWNVDFQAIRKSAVSPTGFAVPADTMVLTDDHAPVEFLDVRPAR
jgi:spermidine synthase